MNKSRVNSLRLQTYNYGENGAYFVTVMIHNREAILGDVVEGQMILNKYGKLVSEIWKDLPNRYKHVMLDEFVIMPNHIHGIIWIQHQPNTPTSIHTVGAGSLLTSNVQSVDSKLPDDTKPALATPQKTILVNSQNTRASNDAKRAGFKHISNDGVNGLNDQSVNEPAPTKTLYGLSEIIRNFKTVSSKRINLLRKTPNLTLWQRGFYDHIIRDEADLNRVRSYIQTNPLRWTLDKDL